MGWTRVLLLTILLITPALTLASAGTEPYIIQPGETVLVSIHEQTRPVVVRGTVLGSVTAPTVIVEADGIVLGNITAFRADTGHGDVTIAGRVMGTITGCDVVLNSSAQVTGTIIPRGSISIHPGASHMGNIATQDETQQWATGLVHDVQRLIGGVVTGTPTRAVRLTGHRPTGFMSGLWSLLGLIALALILHVVAPRVLRSTAHKIGQAPARSLLIGLLALLLLIPVLMLMVMTLIAIPLIPAVVLTAVLGAALGLAAAGLALGERLLRTGDRPLVSLVVGTAMLGALAYVPIGGPLLLTVFTLAGTGALISELGRQWQRRRPPDPGPEPEPDS